MKFRTLLLDYQKMKAFTAAFSVSGLSKLFASIFICNHNGSSLEIAKLITVGYLYNYWTHINKL